MRGCFCLCFLPRSSPCPPPLRGELPDPRFVPDLQSSIRLGHSQLTIERSNTVADTIYDVSIIGSGPAGYTAAIRAGQLGLKAALIEKDPYLGGTCLHVGCIPTKALLFNAEVFDHVKEGMELGLENTAGVSLNWGAIQKRKQGIVDKHAKGLVFLMKKNKVDVIRGYGKLTGPAKNGIHTVALEGGELKSIQAKNVILCTGSSARMLPGLQPDMQVLTNIEVLSLDQIPKSLIVIGSGAVGVEFASIYKSFGTDVTILEMLPRYVPLEDEEISKELMRVYRKRGHSAAEIQKHALA